MSMQRPLLRATCCALCLLLGRAATAANEQDTMVRVVTDPPEAVIVCDGIVRNASPLTLPGLEPGDHLLAAQKQGYREMRRTITLVAGQRMAVEMALEPLLGLVLVQSEPAGADIRIDGADRGKTPLLLTDVRVGKHRMQFASPGFLTKEVDLNIPDRVPLQVLETLTSDSAKLVLDSDPTGAKVTLNGVDKGTTPCTLERIPGGEATLQLALTGYEPYEQALKLAAGQTEQVKAVLKPIPAKLTVVSIPKGARIYVNNQFRGEAPVTIDKLEPGNCRVRAEMDGYDPDARDVTVERAATLTEEFRLIANTGQLQVSTEPSGVKVFVDGKEVGTTAAKEGETDRISDALTVNGLAAGHHDLEFVRKGYASKKFGAEVEKGKAQTVHQVMVKRFVPDCEVRTNAEVFKGVLQEVDPQGNVKIEIKPGIVKTIPVEDVKYRGPLRDSGTP
jgi:hypothetical protein